LTKGAVVPLFTCKTAFASAGSPLLFIATCAFSEKARNMANSVKSVVNFFMVLFFNLLIILK
jgi:hypothetical protein